MSAVPREIARAVDDRDGRRCVRCGKSLFVVSGSRHHRQRRRDGGHTIENIILLCGSGTTGCHGWVHAHHKEAVAEGFIVPANGRATPAKIPVHVAPHLELLIARRTWVLLDAASGVHQIPEAVALEILYDFGLIEGTLP